MIECAANLSGLHVYRSRGNGHIFRCACGELEPPAAALTRWHTYGTGEFRR